MASESTKKTRGKQKIQMKKIENDADKLTTTFSKRKNGIYKKSSELNTLTGAEISFVVFSPAENPFTFAHPSMEAITNRFLIIRGRQNNAVLPLVEAHNRIRIEGLNQQHNELIEKLDVEKEKETELKQKMRGIERNEWWDTPIEELNGQQLQEMEAAFNNIRMELLRNLNESNGSDAIASSSIQSRFESQPDLIPDQPYPCIFNNTMGFDPGELEDLPTHFGDWPMEMYAIVILVSKRVELHV